jgi:hypothetical protein
MTPTAQKGRCLTRRCRDAQAVPRVDVAAATADLARRDYEAADPMEAFFV